MTGRCDINMNGQQVSLRFGMPAVRWFLERAAQDHLAIISDDSVNETGISYILYAGYWNYCIAEDIVPVLKLSDFMDWIELNSDNPEAQAEMMKAGNSFKESKQVNKAVDNMSKQAEEIKKKLTGTKSSPSATENLDYQSGSSEGSPSANTS